MAVVAATFIASIPTRVSMHDLAIGFPFTWHSRQEIVTLGEQSHSFSSGLLLLDVALALAVFVVARVAISRFVRRPSMS